MPLTPEDVQNKRFTVVRFGKSGYDEEEVDTFLDEIEAELRRLLTEGDSLRADLEEAKAAPEPEPQPVAPPEPAPAEDPNETALRTLLLAQRTADDAIAQAKTEAEKLLNEARMHAASIERDAQAEHAAKTAELEASRAGIETQIAELRDFERDYRARLRTHLEGELKDLEKFVSVAPSGPATTPAPGGSPFGTPGADLGSVPIVAPVSPGFEAFTPPPGTAPVPGFAPDAADEPSASGLPLEEPPTPTPLPPHPATLAPKPTLATGFDTDVDAGSDVPSGPPTQADESADDTGD
jgi:DivIVA domain-containing protein